MFKIYDLNMEEITLPKGVMPLEIFVGSVAKNRVTEAVEGRAGVVDYGFNYTDRPVSLFLRIKAADAADFRLLRNEVFATFDVGSAFYVAEADVPSRVLKVVVDESYIPDRLTEEYADFDINCRTLDSVFWESRYTTLDLHDSGYTATAEKYGLVDNIDDEKVKYRFKPDIIWKPNLIKFNESLWEDGSRWSSGLPTANSNGIRLIESNYIQVNSGQEYTLTDESLTSSNIDLWRVFEVNADNSLTQRRFIDRNSGPVTFVPTTDKIVLAADHEGSSNVSKSFLNDGKIKVKLEEGGNFTGFSPKSESFTVYNAGNVTIVPESAYLVISVKDMQSLSGFKIMNKSTGEAHEHTYIMGVERNYEVRGLNAIRGGINVFRYTNRRFISLKPGDNLIEVTGGTFSEINFDFKYLYK